MQPLARFLVIGVHRTLTAAHYKIDMRYSSLFRSRWLALFWSIGILWSAVSFVGWQGNGYEPPANASEDGTADLNQLEQLVGRLQSS